MNGFSASDIALLNQNAYQYVRIVVTPKAGDSFTIENDDIIMGSFSIDRYTSSTNAIVLGSVSAAELNMELNNHDGRFNSVNFSGAKLTVSLSIEDKQNNTQTWYVQIGVFSVFTQPKTLKTIKIVALDNMTLLDKPCDAGVFGGVPASGVLVRDAIVYIANYCNIGMAFGTVDLINNCANINERFKYIPDTNQVLTCRQMLAWIGGLIGVCFYADRFGQLAFGWYPVDDQSGNDYYEYLPSKTYAHDFDENGVFYTGLYYKLSSGTSVLYGNPEYALDLSGNPLFEAVYNDSSGINVLLADIESMRQIIGNGGQIFSATIKPAPYLMPLDLVRFARDNGDDTETIFWFGLSHVRYVLNGTTFIARVGQTEQEYQEVPTSGTGTAQIQRVNGDLMVSGNTTLSGTVAISGTDALFKVVELTASVSGSSSSRNVSLNRAVSPGAGWTPIGIVGAYSSITTFYIYRAYLNEGNAIIGARYTGDSSSSTSVTLRAYVLCLRTSL